MKNPNNENIEIEIEIQIEIETETEREKKKPRTQNTEEKNEKDWQNKQQQHLCPKWHHYRKLSEQRTVYKIALRKYGPYTKDEKKRA